MDILSEMEDSSSSTMAPYRDRVQARCCQSHSKKLNSENHACYLPSNCLDPIEAQ